MKKYLFGILAITLAVGFSAFTTKKAPKPFASQDVYYVSMQENQRVEQGFDVNDDPFDNKEWTITPTTFEDATNWQLTSVSFTQFTSGSASYIGKFTIDNFQASPAAGDGNDANGISLQEALTAIKVALTSGGQFFYPTSTSYTLNVNTGAGTDVTVRNFIRATAAH